MFIQTLDTFAKVKNNSVMHGPKQRKNSKPVFNQPVLMDSSLNCNGSVRQYHPTYISNGYLPYLRLYIKRAVSLNRTFERATLKRSEISKFSKIFT